VLPFHFSCTIFSIQLVYDCYFSTKLFQRKLLNRWILFEHRSPGELEGHTHFDGGGGQGKERRDIMCQRMARAWGLRRTVLGSSLRGEGGGRGGSLVVYPSRKDFTTTRCVL